jgi:translation initiation factor 3 subunit B
LYHVFLLFYTFLKNCSDDEDIYHEEEPPEFETGYGNVIVVDNLPIVSSEKYAKLEGVIRKIYCQTGIIKEGGLWMPVNPDTNMTLGYCFIEFNTAQVIVLYVN